MSLLRNRLRRRKVAPPPNIDGPTYLPLDPLDARLAAWRASIGDPRVLAIFDTVAATVDRDAHRRLQEKYRSRISPENEFAVTKYLDLAPWFKVHARVARALDLDRREPCSILDIGAGGGHFLAIARALGHETLALDLPDHAIYGDLIGLFGLDRVKGGVFLGKALPPEVGRFDLVTIHGQVFDFYPKEKTRWRLPEWAGFLEYLTCAHLRFPGELFVGLNKSAGPNGNDDYFWPLVELAETHGARIVDERARFHFRLEAPLSFPEVESVEWPTTRQAGAESAHRAE